jgi:hypothetical protein
MSYSLPASSEMYVCSRADASSVMRNIPCPTPERTLSIDGLRPDVYEKRRVQKQVSDLDARAREEAAARAEERRKAAAPAESGGLLSTGAAALRAVLDPAGAATAILESNKPRPR